jgi:drug/metabolite transporter (DMT)-like permease
MSATAAPPAGITAALAAALLFGATTPIAKHLLAGSNPLLIAGMLYLGSGVGLFLMRILQDRGWRPSGLAHADRPWLAGAIVAGGMLAPALLMFGLSRSDAATASLLLNLETVFTAALAWWVFREATSRRVVWGFLAILIGAILLAWPTGLDLRGRSLGLLCIAGACLCWGLDNNLTRKISAADPRAIAGFKGLVAGSTNTILALSLGATFPALSRVAGTLALGFLGYGVSLVLFIVALRHLGTVRTGAYFSTAPFIGTALAAAVYGQPLTATFYLAALLIAFGVWLHVTEHHDHEHLHASLMHTHSHRHDAHHQHQHDGQWSGTEPHTHEHQHVPVRHSHAHFPDIHHQHQHRD